jgi:hypothetical protein
MVKMSDKALRVEKILLNSNKSVKIVNDVIVTPEENVYFEPAHEWTTPPDQITIIITRDGAIINGTIENLQYTLPVPWQYKLQHIVNVRTAIESFREKWGSKYLDNIEPQDLLNDLTTFTNAKPSIWGSPDLANQEHQDIWNEVSISPEFKEFAIAGHRLYKDFFPLESKIAEIIDSLRLGARIDIIWLQQPSSDNPPHVPWKLMFQPSISNGDSIDPLGFMGLRYRISYTTMNYSDSLALGDLSGIHCLSWEKKLLEETKWHRSLLSNPPNQICIPNLDGTKSQKDQLLEILMTSDSVNVLYFYCRCNARSGSDVILQFGDTNTNNDTIKPSEFDRDGKLKGKPFIFANACSTFVADPSNINDLQLIFSELGSRGYLGTESRVPEVFASRFAMIFFHFFYRKLDPSPMAVGEALAQTQNFIWTRYKNIGGLFYTYVGPYNLCVASKDEVYENRKNK